MAEKETKTTWNHRIVKSVDDEGTEFCKRIINDA